MINSSHQRTAGLYLAVLFTLQFLLMGSAYLILSGAINWPISLDDPASVALPRMIEKANPIMIGYSCYLMVSLLMIPAAALFNKYFNVEGIKASLIMAMAIFAAVAKMIGIGRWLFVMPTLAQAYIAPDADKNSIEYLFTAFNAYAGGVGEVMGVGFASGIWTILIATTLIRKNSKPLQAIGIFTFIVGLSLFATIPAGFGVDLGAVLTISGVAWNIALLTIGIWVVNEVRKHN